MLHFRTSSDKQVANDRPSSYHVAEYDALIEICCYKTTGIREESEHGSQLSARTEFASASGVLYVADANESALCTVYFEFDTD